MGKVERLVVDLPSELADAVRDAVKVGEFSSESEVIEAVLRAWHGEEGLVEPDLQMLRTFVAEGIADAEAGRFVDADEMFARLRSRYLAKVSERTGG